MLLELGVDGVVLGHSERRAALRRDRPRAAGRRCPAALAAGLEPDPVRGRDRGGARGGETERKLRHQVQEGLEEVPDERLADVVIAYEPIWAIGTGKVATPEQAQEAIALRARAGGRPLARRPPSACGCSTAAASSPTTPPRSSPSPTSTGRWSGGASLDPDGLRPDRGRGRARCRPARDASTAVCLVILDGWGLAEPGPGNAVDAGRHAGVRRALGAAIRTPRSRPGARRSGCPRARWATPRWAT